MHLGLVSNCHLFPLLDLHLDLKSYFTSTIYLSLKCIECRFVSVLFQDLHLQIIPPCTPIEFRFASCFELKLQGLASF